MHTMHIRHTMDKVKKVPIRVDEDVVNELIKLKKYGGTYSDVIRGLLAKEGTANNIMRGDKKGAKNNEKVKDEG